MDWSTEIIQVESLKILILRSPWGQEEWAYCVYLERFEHKKAEIWPEHANQWNHQCLYEMMKQIRIVGGLRSKWMRSLSGCVILFFFFLFRRKIMLSPDIG